MRHGGEGAHERSLGSRGKVRDELAGVGGTADDAAERVGGRGGHKGGAAAQSLVDHAGEGKDIGALVNRASLDVELLGWHVADGAAARAAKAAGRRQPRHAKVGELYIARVVDEHVGGLDIQVEHAVAMGEGERLAQRVGNCRGLVKGERMAVHAMQKVGERHAVDIFHDEVGIGGIVRKVDNLHDIGMLKHGSGVCLAQDIHDVAGGHAGTACEGDALNGDATAQVRVAANLDGAKTAGRERLERLKPLEQLARAGALQGNVRREPGGMLREKRHGQPSCV